MQQRKSSINFSKANTKFWSLYYNGNESYLYINKTEIFKFEANNNISWYKLCSGSLSKVLTKDELSNISLNGIVYNYSVNFTSIKKRH